MNLLSLALAIDDEYTISKPTATSIAITHSIVMSNSPVLVAVERGEVLRPAMLVSDLGRNHPLTRVGHRDTAAVMLATLTMRALRARRRYDRVIAPIRAQRRQKLLRDARSFGTYPNWRTRATGAPDRLQRRHRARHA